MSDVIREERGWAGHFCAALNCAFRRNTLLTLGNTRVVVSTVGNYFPDNDRKAEEIGLHRYYETMAFHAKWESPYWDADVHRDITIFLQCWSVGHIGKHSDEQANKMHEENVELISALMRGGHIKEGDNQST